MFYETIIQFIIHKIFSLASQRQHNIVSHWELDAYGINMKTKINWNTALTIELLNKNYQTINKFSSREFEKQVLGFHAGNTQPHLGSISSLIIHNEAVFQAAKAIQSGKSVSKQTWSLLEAGQTNTMTSLLVNCVLHGKGSRFIKQ